jgi:hypothetical protein
MVVLIVNLIKLTKVTSSQQTLRGGLKIINLAYFQRTPSLSKTKTAFKGVGVTAYQSPYKAPA